MLCNSCLSHDYFRATTSRFSLPSFLLGLIISYVIFILLPAFTLQPRSFFVVKSSSSGVIKNSTSIDEAAINDTSYSLAPADILAASVRVMCFVLTTQKNHQTRAVHVKATWGRRCNKIIFASDAADPQLGAIAASNLAEYKALWSKTKTMFKMAYDEFLNDFDWFLKADDDSYVIMENLRLMLSQYSPDEPLIMGRHLKSFLSGSGYVASRGAVKKFGSEAIKMPSNICRFNDQYGRGEDVEFGLCLRGVGVKVADSRDSLGRQRFFTYSPEIHLTKALGSYELNGLRGDVHPFIQGAAGISDTAVLFHHMTGDQMKILDFYIYNLRPFGILPPITSDDVVAMRENLKKFNYHIPAKIGKSLHVIEQLINPTLETPQQIASERYLDLFFKNENSADNVKKPLPVNSSSILANS